MTTTRYPNILAMPPRKKQRVTEEAFVETEAKALKGDRKEVICNTFLNKVHKGDMKELVEACASLKKKWPLRLSRRKLLSAAFYIIMENRSSTWKKQILTIKEAGGDLNRAHVLKKGCNDSDLITPLETACLGDDREAIEFLLENGALPTNLIGGKYSLSEALAYHGFEETLMWLEESSYVSKGNLLQAAIDGGQVALAKKFGGCGAFKCRLRIEPYYVTFVALNKNQFELLQWLISEAKVNLSVKNQYHKTFEEELEWRVTTNPKDKELHKFQDWFQSLHGNM